VHRVVTQGRLRDRSSASVTGRQFERAIEGIPGQRDRPARGAAVDPRRDLMDRQRSHDRCHRLEPHAHAVSIDQLRDAAPERL
jgi:hypothetical protein